MTAEDYAKDVTKSAGIHRGHPDEETVHNTIYSVMGNKYSIVSPQKLASYHRNIETKMYTVDSHLARKVSPHLSSVLKK
jgi:hypothetical protein